MATVQLGNTKVANRLISYCKERAVEKEGVNTSPEVAKAQMKATREMWGKNDGIQAHHMIQSFKPGEITPDQANEIGQELAEKVAPGHEVMVYTHDDKDHIHNHIVINSVNPEDGKKYQSSKGNLYKVREESDRLCKERGLSVAKDYKAEVRYTQAEKGLIDRDKFSWKDDIREKIDLEKQVSKTYEELKANLKEKHDIDVKERGKNITFTHPENNRKVRGSKLGNDYEKETLQRECEITKETRADQPSQEQGTSALSYEKGRGEPAFARVAEESRGQSKVDGHSERVRQHTDRQGYGLENGDSKGITSDSKDGSHRSSKDDFDFARAREALEQSQRDTYESYGKWREQDEPEQSKDHSASEPSRTSDPSANETDRRKLQRPNDQDHQRNQGRNERDEEANKQKLRRPQQQEHENDIER